MIKDINRFSWFYGDDHIPLNQSRSANYRDHLPIHQEEEKEEERLVDRQ